MRASLAVSALLLFVTCSTSTSANNTATDTTAAKAPDAAADKAALATAHDVLEGSYRSSDCTVMVSLGSRA